MKKIRQMSLGELGAFVCSYLRDNGIDVVLTGGACVFLYTEGQYVSYDLDFIERLTSSRRKLKRVLQEIGFEEEKRYFKHPDTDFFLEFPSGPLAIGDEPPWRLSILSFETGELQALSPTDCLKDRLAAYYHWNDRQCLKQALLIAEKNDVNLAEIERWSKQEGCAVEFNNFRKLLEIQ
ncbi:hypothetical protein [uncultured Desulfuromusa sp.]|uniref:hypothetical protein n=1 Tax=uncultured Desulfuromusa sp. TaxID=219183 RepID=UPI002AA6CA35|nr:hypothetical protein [uncultured Desulfuromusa sp.]